MEESKDLQTTYKIFRTFIYVSLVLEFFEYAIDPNVIDHWGGILVDIHDRIKLMDVYQDGHLLHSKVMTLLIICVTCIGTRNKKHLEFSAKKMVIYPISIGIILIFLSVWVLYQNWKPSFFSLYSSTWLYFLMSVLGTVLCHVALDNISKYLKDGLLKDRFNFENESFEQMEKKIENDYRKALADSSLNPAKEKKILQIHKTLSDSLQHTILHSINGNDEVGQLIKEKFFNRLDTTSLKQIK